MQLNDLLHKVNLIEVQGSTSIEVNQLVFDSRKVTTNDVFIAQKGTVHDGHQHIDDSIVKGAIAIVCEELPTQLQDGITYIKTSNSSITLGLMASNQYGNPSEELHLVGITGTNGKTTTVSLLHNLFEELGHKTVLISTIRIKIHKQEIPSTHTTPDIVTLNRILRQAVDEGCTYGFMEVSSHGIHQHRIAGLTYKIGVFTNITHDHLDYHKTFSEYRDIKKTFFDNLNKEAFALTNIDDKNGLVMLQNTAAKKYEYALKTAAHYKAKIIEKQLNGMLLNFNGKEFWSNIIGRFNAYNLLAAYAICDLLEMDSLTVLQGLSKLQSIDGRFQTVRAEGNGRIGIVDYAHTPDALKNVLETIHEIRQKDQKIITVMGCGGDRDQDKRPLMGAIASKMSNLCLITSDNPRTENPNQIIQSIYEGIPSEEQKKCIKITDRAEAIKTAVHMAKDKDIILVAGKGHETYQEIDGVKHFFNDLDTLQRLLNNQI